MTKETEASLNIYQRINEVRKAVNYVKKNSNVQGQYKAVSHDDVTAMVRNELIKHGIIVIPDLVDSAITPIGNTKSGAPVIRYSGRYLVRFINADNPEDMFSVSLDAHANDHGDKSPGKAVSYVSKYALLKIFNIETGEDDESRAESYESLGPISEDKAEIIKRLIASTETSETEFLAWADAETVEQIKQSDYSRVYAQLKRKENKQAKDAKEAA